MKKLFLLLSIIIAFGCSKQTELSDSVYIPDNEFPNLPAYTEWGYNTFGANYERNVFKYSLDEIPLKVIVENNELSFIFQGHYDNYTTYTNSFLALRFRLPDTNIDVYQDLLVYNDTILDLSKEGIVVEMINYEYSKVLDVIEGELNFKRSQKVFVDNTEREIILSGFFSLQFLVNDIPSEMTDGRFDFGINNENFYILE